jgi:exosome complex component RRP41
MGNTKVICTVTGPTERGLVVTQGRGGGQQQGNGEKAEVLVNISVAGFSGVDRKRMGRNDKCV